MFPTLKDLFSSKPATDDHDAAALRQQGNSHVGRGEWAQAAKCYARAIAIEPKSADCYVSLGFVLQEQGDHAAALEALQHAISLDPAISDAHYLSGRAARTQGDFSGAIAHFRDALERKPDFDAAHRDLITLLIQDSQFDMAKDAARNAVAALPTSAEFLFYLGITLDRSGDLASAAKCYEEALILQPDSPELHNNLGTVRRRQGSPKQARLHYEKALELRPDFVDACINAGAVCNELRISLAAEPHFRRALKLAPERVEAYAGLSAALHALGRSEAALSELRCAIALYPMNARLHDALGSLLQGLGRKEEAVASFQHAIALDVGFSDAHQNLGNAYLSLGRREDALACYRRVTELQPHSGVAHLVAALTGEHSERAPDEYVAKLFDQYADKFDSHLVSALQYNIPDQLADLLKPFAGTSRKSWSILDLGCGTGLVGAAISEFADRLVGVDLSAKMLDKAKARNLYQRLEQSDLLAMMKAEAAGTYDVVIAADVFVYIGKLDALTLEAFRLLRAGGLFAFSVEALENQAAESPSQTSADLYRLKQTGRYVHSQHYINTLAENSGFKLVHLKATTGRINNGVPVPAYLVLLGR